jgi:DNA-binding winged helix-turn-helix (wHTH) protein/tetratricopeptide (TPR) repeat protein
MPSGSSPASTTIAHRKQGHLLICHSSDSRTTIVRPHDIEEAAVNSERFVKIFLRVTVDLPEVYEFDDFTLDVPDRRLSRGTTSIPLAPKAFDILVALVRRAGRLTRKRELMALVWPDTFVETSILTVHISAVRKALSGNNRETRFIETVSGSGYRFAAVVRSIDRASPDADSARISLAVLPFRPLVQDLRDPALELGVTDSVISQLGRERRMVVRPLAAVRKFTSLDQDPVAAGRTLGVQAILDGTIHRADDEVTISARLLDVADGSLRWAGAHSRKLSEILEIEQAIAGEVLGSLGCSPHPFPSELSRKRYTRNSDAYLLYLKGRYLWERRTEDNALKAIERFEAAIEKDPSYALAYSGLGACYGTLSFTNGFPPRDVFRKSKLALERALDLDKSLPEAHESLAGFKFWHQWDWDGAEREFRQCIELAPDQPAPHRFFAYFLSNMGRHDEALREAGVALELEPTSVVTQARLGQFLYQAGDYGRAVERLQQALRLNPDFWLARFNLGRVYERLGRYSDALVELRAAADRARGSGEVQGALGYTLAAAGLLAESRAVYDELERAQARGLVYSYSLALIAAGLGDRDLVYAHFDSALTDRDPGLTFLKIEPRWQPYSSTARFKAVYDRMHFPPGDCDCRK